MAVWAQMEVADRLAAGMAHYLAVDSSHVAGHNHSWAYTEVGPEGSPRYNSQQPVHSYLR